MVKRVDERPPLRLAEVLRAMAKSSDKNKALKANKEAAKHVVDIVRTCTAAAKNAAEDGRLRTAITVEHPMTTGRIVSEEDILADVRMELEGEGLSVTFESQTDTVIANHTRLLITLDWS